MKYKIRMDYTIEDVAAYWYTFHRKPPQRSGKPNPAMLKLGRFFLMVFVVMGVVSILNSLWQGESMRMEEEGAFFRLLNLMLATPLGGILEIAFGLWGLRNTRQPRPDPLKPPYPRPVKHLWKQMEASGSFYSCEIGEEGIWIHDSKSDRRYDYEAMEALWQDETRFYLVQAKPACGAYILRKEAFEIGSPEELVSYWQEKTGKEVRTACPWEGG